VAVVHSRGEEARWLLERKRPEHPARGPLDDLTGGRQGNYAAIKPNVNVRTDADDVPGSSKAEAPSPRDSQP
jgi:hypothetical protein